MFNLTAEERKVVIFLVSCALIGSGINFLLKINAQAREAAAFVATLDKIDLNQADKETLMSVSGIGERLAQRILEYRRAHSVFAQIEELKSIKGLNRARYEKIKGFLVIGK